MTAVENFAETGYAIVTALHRAPLELLRQQIFDRARDVFGDQGHDAETFFNQFHNLEITGARLNELRVQLIQQCTQQIDSGALIFDAFSDTILSLLGPDLLVQKTTNLVIQQPQDPNPSELHRDAPANSPYEIVVWVPLVDCFASKGMYILNRRDTEVGLSFLDGSDDDWTRYESFCLAHGTEFEVPFGAALFFWTGCLHGSRINQESETRWSLNMRYKNLFSPSGGKEPFEFFKVFRMSPLSRLAIDFQRKEMLL